MQYQAMDAVLVPTWAMRGKYCPNLVFPLGDFQMLLTMAVVTKLF